MQRQAGSSVFLNKIFKVLLARFFAMVKSLLKSLILPTELYLFYWKHDQQFNYLILVLVCRSIIFYQSVVDSISYYQPHNTDEKREILYLKHYEYEQAWYAVRNVYQADYFLMPLVII